MRFCYNPPRSKIEQYTYASKPRPTTSCRIRYRPLPGAGRRGFRKTRVITNKIAHLIRGCGYQARHIAAVTFTNKAAREMKERVGQTLGRKEARGLMISTFHTLGLDIIKREYAALGMKANFSLFDDTDQLALLKELTEGLIEDDKVLLQQLISTISNWKNDLKTPSRRQPVRLASRTVFLPIVMGCMMHT